MSNVRVIYACKIWEDREIGAVRISKYQQELQFIFFQIPQLLHTSLLNNNVWTLETLIKDEIGTCSLVNINTQGLGFNWVKRGQLWRWGFNGFTPGSHANTYCVVFSYKGELWKEIKVLCINHKIFKK